MHSQFGEDDKVLEYFGSHKGYLLDIGAYDGHTFSNSHAFIKSGWGGVLIEPSPDQFIKLVEFYRGWQQVTLINAAISSETAFRAFWREQTFQSTLSKDFRQRYTHLNWLDQYYVWTMPASAIPGEFDYISVDTEGNDYAVCCSMESIIMKAKVLCVEHGGDDKTVWLDFFKRIGMGVIMETQLNFVAARDK